MKTAISSWSYHKLLDSGDMSWHDAVDHAASIGADGFECVLGDIAPDGGDIRDFASDLFSYIRSRGLETPIYTTGAELLRGDVSAEIKRIEKHIDIASENGVKLLRHDVTSGFPAGNTGSWDDALAVLVPAVREITEYARGKGVMTCSENHGRFFQESRRVESLFEQVGSDNYRYLCDIGNFGGVDENCAEACSRLTRFICHVHAKDNLFRSGKERDPGAFWSVSRAGNYRRGTVFGQGCDPTFQCLKLIYASGYRGFVSLEFEGIEQTIPAIEAGFANLKAMLSEISK